MLPATRKAIETLAQRCTPPACIIAPGQIPPRQDPPPSACIPRPSSLPAQSTAPDPVFAEVDIASLQLIQPRSIGVEAAGLAAMDWLGIDPILADLGLNGSQQSRRRRQPDLDAWPRPGSGNSPPWRWLGERSALGELLGVNFDTMPLICQLYRASDLLVRHRDKI